MAVVLPFLLASNWVIPTVVTAGGVVGGWLASKGSEGMNPFMADKPWRSTRFHTRVTLWSGYEKNRTIAKEANLGGTTPQIQLWGESGEYLSMNRHKEPFPAANTREFILNPIGKNNQKAHYISLSQWDKDAICIAAIKVEHASGSSDFIMGDIPDLCGWPSYPSGTLVEFNGEKWEPPCFWLDSDNSPAGNNSAGESMYPPEGQPWLVGPDYVPLSVNFHIQDFMVDNETLIAYDANHDLLCKSSRRMQAHPNEPGTVAIYDPPLDYGRASTILNQSDAKATQNNFADDTMDHDGLVWSQSERRPCPPFVKWILRKPEGCWPERKARRDSVPKTLKPRRLAMDFTGDLMYARTGSRWTAEEVCRKDNFLGPSYVNVDEGKYCNLQTKQVLPLCGGEDVIGECFDVEKNQVLAGRSAAQDGGVTGAFMSLISWTGLIDQAGAAPEVVKTYTNVQYAR